MLKSMKQKFGARKANTSEKNEPSASSAPPRQPAPAPASGSNRLVPSSSSKPATSAGAAREKPAPPALNDANAVAYYAEPLPAFKDVSVAEKQHLFVRKLHLCAFTFDFTDGTRHVREKEIKRQTLVELVDYVNTGTGKFTEAVSEDIIFMLSANLFRALPPSKNHDQESVDPDEEEPALEPAWPHLQVLPLLNQLNLVSRLMTSPLGACNVDDYGGCWSICMHRIVYRMPRMQNSGLHMLLESYHAC